MSEGGSGSNLVKLVFGKSRHLKQDKKRTIFDLNVCACMCVCKGEGLLYSSVKL